jgi:hypothetical protein
MTKTLNLRLADETHARLATAADRDHRSVNGQIESYIERGLDADDRREKARTAIDDTLAKADDPEMRAAIVRGIAQYILRGWMHTKRPGPSEAQILARARHDVAEMTAYDYTFPEGEAEKIAADATELADWQRDHNVNWDQWAQGY